MYFSISAVNLRIIIRTIIWALIITTHKDLNNPIKQMYFTAHLIPVPKERLGRTIL